VDRDAELPSAVDEVVGDAGAGEGDDALRQQVQQLLVAAEWGGPSVAYKYSLINSNINLPDCYSEYVEFWPRRSRRGAPDSAAAARR